MRKSAILVAYDEDHTVSEAAALCDSAGYSVPCIMRRRDLRRPKYGISDEAVRLLEEDVIRLEPDVIVFDEILKPSQNYNLASKLHRSVLDREALILEIFESRASSAESRLQVRLAQMKYEMSRAKEKVRLARMGEQPGFMGIGKFEVDVYYNDIRHRMHVARSKLLKVGRQRELHRLSRRRTGFRMVSLAGYTSAGKTRLFNRLTGERREQNSSLFTTLSTTTRRALTGRGEILVSDTVGFISKLPAYMIEAFKSTLEELLYADAILVVIDASDPPPEAEKKFRSCMKTLWELGADRGRIAYALNKSDLVSADSIGELALDLGLDGGRWTAVSAKTGSGAEKLGQMIGGIAATGRPAAWERPRREAV